MRGKMKITNPNFIAGHQERLQNRDLTFGIPEVAILDVAGDIMENKQLEPTYPVIPDPALEAAGHDQQLEKAVQVLLAKLPKK